MDEHGTETLDESCRHVYNLVESVRAIYMEGGELVTKYQNEPVDNPIFIDLDNNNISDYKSDQWLHQPDSARRTWDGESSSWYKFKSHRSTRSLSPQAITSLVNSGVTAWRSGLFRPQQTIAQIYDLENAPVAQVAGKRRFNFTSMVRDTLQSMYEADKDDKWWNWPRSLVMITAMNRLQIAIHELTNFIHALLKLSRGELSPFLLDPHSAEKAIQDLKSTLKVIGLEPSITQLSEFYLLPSSLMAFRVGVIDVLVHVPAHRSPIRRLKVLQYIPSPVKLADHRYIVPDPAHKILIANSDNTLFREMDLSDLALCDHEYGSWHCDHANYLTGKNSKSCLQGLYLSNPKHVLDSCRVSVVDPENFLIQLSFNDFLLYHRLEQKVEIKCFHEKRKGWEPPLVFSGLRHITLPAGCSASSGDFSFEGTLATEREQLKITKTPLDLSPFFNGTLYKDSELDKAFAQLRTMVKEEGQAVSFHRLQKLTDKRYWEKVYAWLYGVLALFTAIYSVASSVWWGTPLRRTVEQLQANRRDRLREDLPTSREEAAPLRDDSEDEGGFCQPFSPQPFSPFVARHMSMTGGASPRVGTPLTPNVRGILRKHSMQTPTTVPVEPMYYSRPDTQANPPLQKSPSLLSLERLRYEMEGQYHRVKSMLELRGLASEGTFPVKEGTSNANLQKKEEFEDKEEVTKL